MECEVVGSNPPPLISSTDASQVRVWVQVQLVHAITYNYGNFLKLIFVTTAAIMVHKFASILCTGLLSVNTATTGFFFSSRMSYHHRLYQLSQTWFCHHGSHPSTHVCLHSVHWIAQCGHSDHWLYSSSRMSCHHGLY